MKKKVVQKRDVCLTSGKDEEAATAQALRDKKDSEKQAAFKREVAEMVAARQKLMQHHQGVVKQRDMCKKMFLSQKQPQQALPNTDTRSNCGQHTSIRVNCECYYHYLSSS